MNEQDIKNLIASSGEELTQIYATLFTMPPATVAKLKDVLK